jgi:hypothetical protein
MFFDRWRARRAILSRSAPSSVEDEAHPRLREVVESLLDPLGTPYSLGDPSWHYRWEGDLQLVGLDATQRSVTDVRQRLLRLVHELELRHLSRSVRRVLAVVLCAPQDGEDLEAWHARLRVDQGEVGERDWRAARRRIELLAITPDGQHAYFGTDVDLRRAVESQLPEHRG